MAGLSGWTRPPPAARRRLALPVAQAVVAHPSRIGVRRREEGAAGASASGMRTVARRASIPGRPARVQPLAGEVADPRSVISRAGADGGITAVTVVRAARAAGAEVALFLTASRAVAAGGQAREARKAIAGDADCPRLRAARPAPPRVRAPRCRSAAPLPPHSCRRHGWPSTWPVW